MKTHRAMVAVVLSLLVGMVGALAGSTSPALAVVSVGATSATMIAYSGRVDGPPEAVALNGFVRVTTKVVRDPDFGKPPIVLLNVDFSGVTGVGLITKAKYVTSGEQALIRPLVPVDVVDVTFAVFSGTALGQTRARAALASLTLAYDTGTGALTAAGANGSVSVADSLATAPVQ